MLSESLIAKAILKKNKNKKSNIIIKRITNSTNDDAKKILLSTQNELTFIFAEQQKSGRGQRKRKWVSPLGKNIYLSVAWKSRINVDKLDGLSLAIGVIIIRALKEISVNGLKIKWPNDIYFENKKLAGILIETSLSKKNNLNIVIGIGINVNMTLKEGKTIDQEWTSIKNIKNKKIERNTIASNLINHLINLIDTFPNQGFSSYLEEFNSLNYFHKKNCMALLSDGSVIKGKASKVNSLGELIFVSKDKTYTLRSGEVTIRDIN